MITIQSIDRTSPQLIHCVLLVDDKNLIFDCRLTEHELNLPPKGPINLKGYRVEGLSPGDERELVNRNEHRAFSKIIFALFDGKNFDFPMEIESDLQLVITNSRELKCPGKHSKIESLRVKEMDDAGMRQLASLGSLRSLDLSGTRISDAALLGQPFVERLEVLDLGDTQVGDDTAREVVRAKELHTLDVRSTRITDTGLASIGEISQLKSLNLSGTKITDSGILHLRRLTNLERLDLSDTMIGDASLKVLANCRKLNDMFLIATKVTDVGIKALKELSELTGLYLSRTTISDAGLTELSNQRPLWWLAVVQTHVTAEGCESLQEKWPFAKIFREPV